MSAEQENKNMRKGIFISVGIHAFLLLIMFFLLAWSAPDPPIPEYGIEMNFGTTDVGSGDVQPKTPPMEAEEIAEEEAEPAAEPEEEVEEVVEETPVEAVTQPIESPVVEKKPEKKPEPKPKKITPKKEVKKPVEKPKPKPKVKNTYPGKGKSDGNPSKSGDGDDNKAGDKGDPKGSLDSKSLYGSGGKGGSSLDLAGWKWDRLPRPNDTSDESGRIVFEIKVDDQGEVVSVRTIEKTVSPAVERIYKAEVERLTFTRTSGGQAAAISTGRITFILKAS